MKIKYFIAHLLLLSIAFILGCSGQANPISPHSSASDAKGGMGTLGLFNLILDPENLSGELVSLRTGTLTDVLEVVDITNFLQIAPCTDCAKIASVGLDSNGYIVVSIGIKHPFDTGDPQKPVTGKNRADLHVFNVEGIVVSDIAGTEFPAAGKTVAGFSLINADGFTGYLDDSLDDFYPTDATIHPYILHFDDYSQGNFGPSNPMGFESVTDPPPGGNLVMPMGSDYDYQDYYFNLDNGAMNFIYAIGCTYAVSSANLNQRFSPEYRVPQHNKKAASQVWIDIISNELQEGDLASSAEIEVKVVDINHGVETGPGLDKMLADSSVSAITIEIPGIETSQIIVDISSPNGNGHDPTDPLVFPATITNTAGAGEGIYTGLVKVNDSYSPGLNESPLLNGMDGIKRVGPSDSPLVGLFAISEFATYQTFNITVAALPQNGWARTWGGIYYDESQSVSADNSGNIYIAGWFEGTVDFDPSDGTDIHNWVDASDVFLSKFDYAGNFLWARTWGGTWPDYARGVGTDASGNIYVTGYFRDTVDFDPGGGIENITTNGNNDVFLSKFNPSGDFQWVRTWGGTGNDQNRAVVVDDAGNSYVTGFYYNTVDFNPGGGIDEHTSGGMGDAFLSKFDSSGTFIWARTWGGLLYEQGRGTALDGTGNIYVTGWFADIVDFDPGAGIVEYTTNGVDDAFLSKFDSSGTFQWARIWGGLYMDYGYDVAADTTGNSYVTGKFWDEVDFDPSIGGIDIHLSEGGNDAYLSKFNTSGDYLWVKTWGNTENDLGEGTAVDGSGNIYVTGAFMGTVDFDPDTGVDEHISNGSEDIFLCKFDPNGNSLWAQTWGGIEIDHGYRTAVDNYNNACVAGTFMNVVDFDPGSVTDEHTSNGGRDVFLSKFLPDGSW